MKKLFIAMACVMALTASAQTKRGLHSYTMHKVVGEDSLKVGKTYKITMSGADLIAFLQFFRAANERDPSGFNQAEVDDKIKKILASTKEKQ